MWSVWGSVHRVWTVGPRTVLILSLLFGAGVKQCRDLVLPRQLFGLLSFFFQATGLPPTSSDQSPSSVGFSLCSPSALLQFPSQSLWSLLSHPPVIISHSNSALEFPLLASYLSALCSGFCSLPRSHPALLMLCFSSPLYVIVYWAGSLHIFPVEQ
ncbi:hypothetical protein BJX63DRAFT_190867 [Aspergillus granulosus]|uniref:Secreted protein n=1 Tax=Aspergillus granulosus TaxID=176169 RepID=A0ABR4HJ73_9EURO